MDSICRNPRIDIDLFTTDYSDDEHIWIHGHHGYEVFITYQITYEQVLSTSVSCCDLLTKMFGLMLAWHAATRLAYTYGAIGTRDIWGNHSYRDATSGTLAAFDLVDFHGRKSYSGSTLPLYISALNQACGSCDNQRDDTLRNIINQMNKTLGSIKDLEGFGDAGGIMDYLPPLLRPGAKGGVPVRVPLPLGRTG